MNNNRTRPHAITQAAFDRLPALLYPGEFTAYSGIEPNKLNTYVDAGIIGVHQSPARAGGRRMFYKSDLAKLAGFRCDLPGSRPADVLARLVQVLQELDASGLDQVLRQLTVLRAHLPPLPNKASPRH